MPSVVDKTHLQDICFRSEVYLYTFRFFFYALFTSVTTPNSFYMPRLNKALMLQCVFDNQNLVVLQLLTIAPNMQRITIDSCVNFVCFVL